MLRRQIVITAMVFILSIIAGFWIAGNKHVWNDEFYTLASSTQQSYSDIILGHVQEGNNSPLFYLLQKTLLPAFGYHLPDQWRNGDWNYPDPSIPSARFMLRIIPVVCMALSIALIFYLFYEKYSLWMGLYSLVMYFSSYMVWVYWAEARPYALVVLLTTTQIYFLVRLLDQRVNWDKQWWILALIHTCLSFTFILSLGPIFAASLVVWCKGYRKLQNYLWITIIPTIICCYYYALAPKYSFWFNMSPEQLVRDSFPRWELYILVIMSSCILADQLKEKLPFGKKIRSEALEGVRSFLLFTYAVLFATALVLILFYIKASPTHQGFTVANRYFIYLMPLGVISSVWFSSAIVKFYANYRWVQIGLIVIVILLVGKGFYKIIPKAIYSLVGG